MIQLISESSGSSPWLMFAILGGLMLVMVLVSVIPQRKRRKQAQEMMAKISKGDTIKTIGGFIGTVTAVADTSYILNIGTEDSPVIVTIDKAAVYTVVQSVNAPAPQVVETTEGNKIAVEDEVNSLDDAEDDAKRAEKAKLKADKKAEKKGKKDDAEPVEVEGEVVANDSDKQ